MFDTNTITISDEEKKAIDTYLQYMTTENVYSNPENYYKITRKKYNDHVEKPANESGNLSIQTSSSEYTAEMNRRFCIYNPTGEIIYSLALPQNSHDPGTHAYASVLHNNERKWVFHGPKGSTCQSPKQFSSVSISFKPILTEAGIGIMKRRNYPTNNQNYSTLFSKFSKNSKIINMLPDTYIGNVARTTGKNFKINQYMFDAGTDLVGYLRKNRRLLSETEKKSIMTGIIVFLAKLHKAGIVHTDVKPENICISSSGIGFIDFDESYRVNIDNQSGCGTIAYYPPEFFRTGMYPFNFEVSYKSVDRSILIPSQDRHFTQATDVFSLGLVLKFFAIKDLAYQNLINHMLEPEASNRLDLKILPTNDLNAYIHNNYSPNNYSPSFFDPCPWAPEKKKRKYNHGEKENEENNNDIVTDLNSIFNQI